MLGFEIIEGIFTPEECAKIIKSKEEMRLVPCGTIMKGDSSHLKLPRFARQRLAEYCKPMKGESYIKLRRYGKGASVDMHKDEDYFPYFCDLPVKTIAVRLNDDYEGGKYVVRYKGRRKVINLKIGSGILFAGDVGHSMGEITSGNRYTILAWSENK
jgi:predicted 2-oxoglutarate/Fe(II)-dependent dioxygenase YbiX